LELLNKAKKFKDWLDRYDNDSSLAKEYLHETTRASWLETLPTKSVRWVVFNGIGVIVDILGGGGLGTTASLATSAFDSFIFDKLAKGWKPNQFIQNDLERFLRGR
jgi:hypothetical protein